MIISHKYKFIFIKTYKTAGTSLEVYLDRYCDDGDVLTEIFPPIQCHRPRNVGVFYNHMSAVDISRNVGCEVWDSYRKFCVERNPWDKFLSFYWMERVRSGGQLEIDDFLNRENIGTNWHLYTDETQTKPIVDNIIKYEDLGNGLAEVLGGLGIPWAGGLSVKAKSEYRSDRRNYREVLTEQQAENISRKFSKEINWHGYKY